MLADGPAVSQPAQPQVLAQQLPQVARFQVSNIVAKNQAILRRLSSGHLCCDWKEDDFKMKVALCSTKLRLKTCLRKRLFQEEDSLMLKEVVT